MSAAPGGGSVQWEASSVLAGARDLTNRPAAQVSTGPPVSSSTTHTNMSDAEVKNDVAAEAPSAEELKAKKRSAEVAYLL